MSDNTYFRSLVLIQNSNLTFSASASVSSTGKEVFLSKSVSPTFLVENLLPSTSYTVKVWTYNSNGASQPSYISTTTLNVSDIAERKLKETEEETSLVWLGVFVGMPVLVVVFVVAVMSLKILRHDTIVISDTEEHNV